MSVNTTTCKWKSYINFRLMNPPCSFGIPSETPAEIPKANPAGIRPDIFQGFFLHKLFHGFLLVFHHSTRFLPPGYLVEFQLKLLPGILLDFFIEKYSWGSCKDLHRNFSKGSSKIFQNFLKWCFQKSFCFGERHQNGTSSGSMDKSNLLIKMGFLMLCFNNSIILATRIGSVLINI